MKKLLFLFTLLFFRVAFGQQITQNAGTDFFFTSFSSCPELDSRPDSAIVYVVGKEACAGYLENPVTGYRVDFNIAPFVITEIKIPAEQVSSDRTPGIQHKAIYLHTGQPVYLYLQSSINNCEGSSAVSTHKTPVEPLTHFTEEAFLFVSGMNSQGSIIATEDDTEITIWGNNGEIYTTVRLSKGEIYCFSLSLLFFNDYNCPVKVTSNCKVLLPYCYTREGSYSFLDAFWNRKASCKNHTQLLGKEYIHFSKTSLDFVVRPSYLPHFCLGHFSVHLDFSVLGIPVNPPRWFTCFTYVDYMYSLSELPTVFISGTQPFFPRNYRLLLPNFGTVSYEENSALPTDRMVEEVIFVTRSQPSPSIDTVFTDLSIVTTPAGRYTTAVNGNLIPVDSFHTIPGLEDRYWFARFFYTHDAPEVLHVTNPLGFSASMNEFAYYMGVRSDFWNSPQHYITHIGLCRSGGNGQTSASLDALEISPVRCAGDTLFLQALNNYFEYQTDWYIGDSVYLNREEVAFPLMQANDSLTVQLIIHRSCPDTITKTIFVEIPPTIVFLPADTVICQGSAITVSSPNATHFLWSDGVTGSTRFFDTSGTFTVTASNSCQTQASATVELRFFDPLEVNLGNDTNLCRLASLLLDATHPQASFYEWQDGSTGATYTVYYDGEYWVKLTDPCTSAADSINVTYFDRINLQLGNDTLLCEGQVLILNATTPVAEYQWSSGYTGAIQEVYASGTYSVTVSNPCHTVSASVKVSFEDCSTFIFLPNAITPNGDGVNDVFKPQFNHPEEVLEYEIVIYNRWGNLLFCSRDFTQGWSGDTAPDGVYVYRISYKTRNAAKKEITGTVTVVR